MFSAALSSGTGWWQRHQGEVFRDPEFARGVPTGLIKNNHGVCAGCDGTADLFEVFAHCRRVGIWRDDDHTWIDVPNASWLTVSNTWAGKLFLKLASPPGPAWDAAGGRWIWEKPSFLRTRPRLTSDRSTAKRALRTRLRSTQRPRDPILLQIGASLHEASQFFHLLFC